MPAARGETNGTEARVRSETALQRALKAAASEAWLDPVVRAHAFFAHWAQLAGTDPVTPEAICSFCISDAVPNPALLDIADVVGQLDWPTPRTLNTVHRRVVEVVELMTLVLCERRIDAAGLDPASQEESGLLVVPMADRLAAALVAAAWLQCRVKMSVDAKGRPLVLNLLTDLPPLEFGWRDVKQAHSAELLAYLNHTRGGGAEYSQARRQELETVRRRGLQDEADISDMLAAARRRRDFTDPVFGLTQKEHPEVEAGTRVWLRDQYGLESFTWSRPDEGGLDEKFRKLQGNLLQHIEDIIQRVYAGASTVAKSTKVGQDGPAGVKVFLSYSHQDKADWHDLVKGHLRALEFDGRFEVWSDQEIGTGDDWREKIDTALKSCSVGVMLISMDFLNSVFINNVELPDLIRRRVHAGFRVYPVLHRTCAWKAHPELQRLQIRMKDGEKSLAACTRAEVEAELTALVEEIQADFGGIGKNQNGKI